MEYTSFGPDDPRFAAGFLYPGAGANVTAPTGPALTNNAGVPILAGPADQATPGWMAASAPLVQALQDASKSSILNPKDPPPLAAAKPLDVSPGRPRLPGSLDALVQLLEKQRAQYGTLSGQPVAQPRQLGLLGF
jgi:hypothetical protein